MRLTDLVESDKHSWLYNFLHQRLFVQRRDRLPAGLQLDAGLDAHELFGDRNRVDVQLVQSNGSPAQIHLGHFADLQQRILRDDPVQRVSNVQHISGPHWSYAHHQWNLSRWGSSRSSFSLSSHGHSPTLRWAVEELIGFAKVNLKPGESHESSSSLIAAHSGFTMSTRKTRPQNPAISQFLERRPTRSICRESFTLTRFSPP